MFVPFSKGQMLRVIEDCPNYGHRTQHLMPIVKAGVTGEFVYAAPRPDIGTTVVMIRLAQPRHTVMVRASALVPHQDSPACTSSTQAGDTAEGHAAP